MQQRRVRLGDVLDDYCPRERRITNHAVVAMIEDEVKQTRCTTCDAEHEYKNAKAPPPRRKASADVVPVAPSLVDTAPALLASDTELPTQEEPVEAAPPEVAPSQEPASAEDEWPVHRPLIRATFPRPEGQAPERKAPDFTLRQTGGRFDGRNGNRAARGQRHGRHGQGPSSAGQSRFDNSFGPGSSRHGAGHPHGGQRSGNRQGPGAGQRGRAGGHGAGHKPGHGRGPKRGR
jgi:hypothetical protein